MDTDFFKELERFTLLVRKRVSTAYSGGRKSMRFGHGISPVGYREYRKGDDFKLVDWKVYGRTEKLFIREHEEERSLVVHILLGQQRQHELCRKVCLCLPPGCGLCLSGHHGEREIHFVALLPPVLSR